jgi:hypothetical protein
MQGRAFLWRERPNLQVDLRSFMIAALPFTTSHAEWVGLVIGVVSLIGIGGIVSTLICHHTGCYRRGRFRHGHYKLCHIHHPHVPSDGKITAEHIETVEQFD